MSPPAARGFASSAFAPPLVLAALGALAVLAPSPAAAQPSRKPPASKLDAKTAEAKRLFDDGAELYTRGSYEEAIEAWEKSYEISKKPLIFESIANAYERLGQPKKARDYLSRWRAVAPADEHDLLDARLKKLDERIARDDALEAQRKAEADKAKRERDAEAPPQTPEAGPPASGATIEPGNELLGPGLALAGGGVGAVVVGVTLDIIAANRRPDAGSACAAAGDRQVCRASERDGIEGSNTLATVGDVIWITGAVAAAAGVVLIVLHEPPKEGGPAQTTRVGPLVSSKGGGLSILRTF